MIDDVLKGIKLLDSCLWANNKHALIVSGKEELSSVGNKSYHQ